jgi:hypothetical protein
MLTLTCNILEVVTICGLVIIYLQCCHSIFDQTVNAIILFFTVINVRDRLCGLVVRVLGYRSGGQGSIPGTTRISGGKKNCSGSGTGSTQPREYN